MNNDYFVIFKPIIAYMSSATTMITALCSTYDYWQFI